MHETEELVINTGPILAMIDAVGNLIVDNSKITRSNSYQELFGSYQYNKEGSSVFFSRAAFKYGIIQFGWI